MALITIWIEDGLNGNVRIESDPPLTKLKMNAEEWKNMTPAVSYAMVAIAAVMSRNREIKKQEEMGQIEPRWKQ